MRWRRLGRSSRPATRDGCLGSSSSSWQKFEEMLAGLPQVDLTEAIAQRAGEIEGEAQANDPNGSGVGAGDAIVAATALELDQPVVTNDRKDFANRIQKDLGYSTLHVELYT